MKVPEGSPRGLGAELVPNYLSELSWGTSLSPLGALLGLSWAILGLLSALLQPS